MTDKFNYTSDSEFINNLFKDVKDIKKFTKERFEIDCKTYMYTETIYPKQKRIVAIGDIHGDYDVYKNILEKANLVKFKKDGNKYITEWIGKDTFVVQLGDQIDNCRPYIYKCDNPLATKNDSADDIKILELSNKLDELAHKDGGRFISLLGNHELMNVEGNMNYVSYENIMEFEGKTIENKLFNRKEMFSPGNKYSKILGCTRLSCVVIGSFMFVHGGIIPNFIEDTNIKTLDDLYKLNYIIRMWLLGEIKKKHIENFINGEGTSVFWNRVLGELPNNLDETNKKCMKYLDPVLRIYKIKNMVIGHTPQWFHNKAGITSTCGNKLWRVDVGASKAFDQFDEEYHDTGVITDLRKAQALEILNDEIVKIIK